MSGVEEVNGSREISPFLKALKSPPHPLTLFTLTLTLGEVGGIKLLTLWGAIAVPRNGGREAASSDPP